MIELLTPSIFHGLPVRAVFSTRRGGVSQKPYDSLNFGFESGDDELMVAENHSLLYEEMGVDREHSVFMNQVHGASVQCVDQGGVAKATDGVLTASAGLMLGVRTADCIPLLMSDEQGEIVAAVHCGWKPLVAGIAEHAVEMLARKASCEPSHILAAIGPAAGPCCYEIGREVAEKLHPKAVVERDGSLYGNLAVELRLRLAAAGLRDESIENMALCTICDPERFYSYRRDGAVSGRMLSCIMRI